MNFISFFSLFKFQTVLLAFFICFFLYYSFVWVGTLVCEVYALAHLGKKPQGLLWLMTLNLMVIVVDSYTRLMGSVIYPLYHNMEKWDIIRFNGYRYVKGTQKPWNHLLLFCSRLFYIFSHTYTKIVQMIILKVFICLFLSSLWRCKLDLQRMLKSLKLLASWQKPKSLPFSNDA